MNLAKPSTWLSLTAVCDANGNRYPLTNTDFHSHPDRHTNARPADSDAGTHSHSDSDAYTHAYTSYPHTQCYRYSHADANPYSDPDTGTVGPLRARPTP